MRIPEILISEGRALPAFPLASGPPLASAEESPDARVILLDHQRNITARVALWWRDTPVLEGQRVGTIGDFAATSQADADLILEVARTRLRDADVTYVVGPMNGNTWRSYRFVDAGSGRPPFLLEPRNPPEYAGWWAQAGFTEISRYSSSLMPLDGQRAVSPALEKRFLGSGISIRPLDPSRYDDELRVIHRLSLKSFSENFLYTPLDEESFLQSYRKVRSHVDPDFVLIAERAGAPCGFVFGIADLEAAARGEPPAVIVKTLAVDPEARCAGLGSLLVDELHRAARAKGFRESIHALQHQRNTSLKITGRHDGRVFREYVLFSREP